MVAELQPLSESTQVASHHQKTGLTRENYASFHRTRVKRIV